jgi:hypothetical protein
MTFKNFFKVGALFFIFSMVSCVQMELQHRAAVEDSHVSFQEKNNLTDYAYLESRTNHYNSDKIVLQKEKDIETALAVVKLNDARDVHYRLSPEEQIERKAMQEVEEKKWEDAFATLLKYEPILTYNKNITNMMVLCSFKLKKYDFAVQQLQLSLNLPDETLLDAETRKDRVKLLAHAFYLNGKEDQALSMYESYNRENIDQEVKTLLSLIEDDKKLVVEHLYSQVDVYAKKYIYSEYSKDAVIVREEFKPITEPMRRPAGLELKKTK